MKDTRHSRNLVVRSSMSNIGLIWRIPGLAQCRRRQFLGVSTPSTNCFLMHTAFLFFFFYKKNGSLGRLYHRVKPTKDIAVKAVAYDDTDTESCSHQRGLQKVLLGDRSRRRRRCQLIPRRACLCCLQLFFSVSHQTIYI